MICVILLALGIRQRLKLHRQPRDDLDDLDDPDDPVWDHGDWDAAVSLGDFLYLFSEFIPAIFPFLTI